jgi:hypothetical protein
VAPKTTTSSKQARCDAWKAKQAAAKPTGIEQADTSDNADINKQGKYGPGGNSRAHQANAFIIPNNKLLGNSRRNMCIGAFGFKGYWTFVYF